MAKETTFKHTGVFTKNFQAYQDPNLRYIINQGGSRSSKTYSLCQLLIYLCMTTHNLKVSVVRKSFPALRGSVMRDMMDILKEINQYSEKMHNRTQNIYTFINGSEIEFMSIDDSQKVRGRKRDILFVNEANELEQEEFVQLMMRTSDKAFIDFNPSDTESWIYNLLEEPKSLLIKSTYKDNPFLTDDQKDYIEDLIKIDQNYYRIYALGEVPLVSSRIYSHFKEYTLEPHDADIESINFGLDFGYNHPTSLVKITKTKQGRFFIRELIYSSGLTTTDLLKIMNGLDELKKYPIYCDYSRPEIIMELNKNGYKAKNAVKEVKEGINTVKSSEIYLHRDSINTWKEYRLYSWKSLGESILDEPIKLNDDAMDAIRYGIHSAKKKVSNPRYTKLYS